MNGRTAPAHLNPTDPMAVAGTAVDDLHTTGPLRRELSRTARSALYLLLDLPLTVAAFCVAAIGVSGSLSILLAPLLLPGTGMALRALARVERGALGGLLGIRTEEPPYPAPLRDARDLREHVLHPQLWLDVVWALVGFLASLLTFTLVVTSGGLALSGVTAPLWLPFLRRLDGYRSSAEDLFGTGGFWPDLLVNLGLGAAGALLLWAVCRWIAPVQGHAAAVLLSGRATQDNLAASRRAHRASQQAELSGLQRLERDLHDGPQQQLVRLQMDLARARAAVDADPQRAGRMLDDASRLTRDTLGELRQLSRGIAPPVLVDRGLVEAVRERAVSHPLPVAVTGRLERRLPEHLETALYYAASEALANAAKHADAQHVRVSIGQRDGWVGLTVADDGRGGADPASGHGLAGLAQRLEGVYGRLTVDSPVGGPTRITAEVPLP
ncbi:sensor histidine kinase [Kytococcus schroeteri]|uniref:sensor histidine kinase n=1 Tax=Kytococcus schroeteri TaxID=138300 RepID=UPI0015DEA083|nr:sensor domain-containing protein [Kytococcus schroeteri]